MTSTLAAPVDLSDPGTFTDGVPHDALAELRRSDPVHWQPMDGEPGFWAVLRHADVVTVARQPEIFSAEAGGITIEDVGEETLQRMRQMLLAMDPPRHSAHRAPLSHHFRPKVIAQLEGRVREVCRAILALARERGEVEFVGEVAAQLPARMIGELFGLPEQDWDSLRKLAERNPSSQDPDLGDPDGANNTGGSEMAAYAMEQIGRAHV